MRSESQMPGSALGTTMRARIRRSGSSRVRPMSMKSHGTRLTLSMISRTCWKKVPIQMMRNFWVSPVPDHRMVSGTKATTGM